MARRIAGRNVFRKIACLGMFPLKVHREEVTDLYLVEQRSGTACEVATLSRIDREHDYINRGIFAFYAVDNNLEVIFGFLRLALGGGVFPMPVVQVTGMKDRRAILCGDKEAYSLIG